MILYERIIGVMFPAVHEELVTVEDLTDLGYQRGLGRTLPETLQFNVKRGKRHHVTLTLVENKPLNADAPLYVQGKLKKRSIEKVSREQLTDICNTRNRKINTTLKHTRKYIVNYHDHGVLLVKKLKIKSNMLK